MPARDRRDYRAPAIIPLTGEQAGAGRWAWLDWTGPDATAELVTIDQLAEADRARRRKRSSGPDAEPRLRVITGAAAASMTADEITALAESGIILVAKPANADERRNHGRSLTSLDTHIATGAVAVVELQSRRKGWAIAELAPMALNATEALSGIEQELLDEHPDLLPGHRSFIQSLAEVIDRIEHPGLARLVRVNTDADNDLLLRVSAAVGSDRHLRFKRAMRRIGLPLIAETYGTGLRGDLREAMLDYAALVAARDRAAADDA